MPTKVSTAPRMPVKRHGRGRGSSRSTRYEHLLGLQSDRSLEELEADLAASRARIAEINNAAGITEDMTIFEKREARERYHESQVKQRCRQCKAWVPRVELSRNLKFCKRCIAVHRAEQSAYVNRPLPVASANPDVPQLDSEVADLFPREHIAALDAEPVVETPVFDSEPAEPDNQWEFFCKGCGRLRPSTERAEIYVKIGCRIIETLEVCRPCSSQVSVCGRG